MTAKRDFLTLLDASSEELHDLVRAARAFRTRHADGFDAHAADKPLDGATAVMIFEAKSTRTRVGFEAGMHQMGGHSIVLKPEDTQLGRGEPIRDTARILSEMIDVIIVRTLRHETVEELAEWADVPVINAMTDRFHPCQLLADVQTFEELRGPIAGRTVAFVGDGYNMCNSYINAAHRWGFNLRIASPEGFEPDPAILGVTNNASLAATPQDAVDGADLVVTDVWSSMGHEEDAARRKQAFADYQVNEALMESASADALFMHCLPAHRGEEISDTMLEDERSVVWQEAGNRLHSQKALLQFMLKGTAAK